ncbi:MAG: thioesterase [Burkholderiales bacterium RIFCSPLOWO2_02_FULL_57_36]|nr:MAG: thioesterase [Burkholderiales bacterium RIFCSPLOWO2_02_FULL_57_36]
MAIWKDAVDLAQLAQRNAGTAASHLGIEFTGFGEDWLAARMPVDHRTVQPMGILHGGASVLLAETLGSVASNLCVDSETHYCVGLDINANHIRSVKDKYVIGEARPIHIGRSTHVWEIRISDSAERLTCISRLTMSVLPRDR